MTAHDASNPLPEPPATGGIALPERYINTDWSAPGDDLPTGEGHWQRKGGWSIVVGELSHSCRDAYAGLKDSEIVTGMLSDLPKGGWQRAVPASELTALREQLAEAKREAGRLRVACSKQNNEIEQILGKALGYPWFKDDQENFPGATEAAGVCVGEHVAESLAMEVAEKLTSARKTIRDIEREEDERDTAIRNLCEPVIGREQAWGPDGAGMPELVRVVGEVVEKLTAAQSRIRELEANPRLAPAPPEVPLGFDPDDYPLY